MRSLIVNAWMSLDGVVQAPSYPDEDTDGGFAHGGWHTRYFDGISQQWVPEYVPRNIFGVLCPAPLCGR
jgi:hypothetical protein